MRSNIEQKVQLFLAFYFVCAIASPDARNLDLTKPNMSFPLHLAQINEEKHLQESISRMLLSCDPVCLTCQKGVPGQHKCITCKMLGSTPYLDIAQQTCLASCPPPLIGKLSYRPFTKYCALPCSQNNFLYPDGSCASSCPPPFSYNTDVNGIKYCTSICTSTASPAIHSDGTCSQDCSSPSGLTASNVRGITLCINSCVPPSYLYWDGSCQPSCPFPLEKHETPSLNKCVFSCTGDQYLYPDGTCFDNCESFLVSSTQHDSNFCDSPCHTAQTGFTYWDGSCSTTCSSPLVPIDLGGIQVCQYPCDDDEYLYSNGECSDTCSTPLDIATFKGESFCNSPCPAGQWVFADKTCDTSCSSLMTQDTLHAIKLCNSPCSPTQYLFPDGTCHNTCDPFLIESTVHGSRFCNSPCSSASGSGYAYWDTTCNSACALPLVQATYRGISLCQYPCNNNENLYSNGNCEQTCILPMNDVMFKNKHFCNSPCATGEWVFADQTCATSCTLPMVQGMLHTTQLCNSPCSATQYLFPDGTCNDTCNAFLVKSTVHGTKFCKSPCSAASSGYAYWDGSCSSTCALPLVQTTYKGIDICEYPCQSNLYLYPNGDCNNTCSLPLNKISIKGKNLCSSPCSTAQYVFPNQACNASCTSPMTQTTVHTIKLCKSPCGKSPQYYYPDKNQCQAKCNTRRKANQTEYYKVCYKEIISPNSFTQTIVAAGNTAGTASSIGLAATSLASPGDSSSASVGTLAKMMLYIRYINIDYPSQLGALFKGTQASSVSPSLGLEMSTRMKEGFHYLPMPDQFTEYNVNSSFLVNFWDSLIYLSMASGLTLLIFCFEQIAKRIMNRPLLATTLQKIRFILQNFTLLQLYTNCSDIILYTSLQLQRVDIRSNMDLISLILACVFSAIIIFLLSLHVFVVHRHQKTRQRSQNNGNNRELEAFELKNQGFYALFGNFKILSFSHESYLFFAMLRTIAFNLILSLLYKYPLLQAVIIVTLNVLILAYLGLKRPFKQLVNFLQQLTAELILLIVNSGVLLLAILDANNVTDLDKRDTVGHIIIVCSLVFKFMPSGFTLAKIVILVYELYKERIKRRDRRVNPLDTEMVQASAVRVSRPTIDTSSIINLNNNTTVLQKEDITDLNSSTISTTKQNQNSTGQGLSFISNTNRASKGGSFKEDLYIEQEQEGVSISRNNNYNLEGANGNPRRRQTTYKGVRETGLTLTHKERIQAVEARNSLFIASSNRLQANRSRFADQDGILNPNNLNNRTPASKLSPNGISISIWRNEELSLSQVNGLVIEDVVSFEGRR